MSMKPCLTYDSKNDIVIGFEDTGGLMGRTQYISNQVLILMIRSVCGKKKMPIGFYFSRNSIKSSSLKEIVEEAIMKFQDSGINIYAIVNDQGSNTIRSLTLLGATTEKPHLEMI